MSIKAKFYNGEAKSPFHITTVDVKDFKTGSDGYFTNGRVDVPMGLEYITLVLVGDTEATMTVSAKDFKTGSKGFFASGKLATEEGMFQAQTQFVLVGSGAQKADENGNLKPKAKNPSGRAYTYQVQLVRIGSKVAEPVVVSPVAADVAAANAAIDAMHVAPTSMAAGLMAALKADQAAG